MVIGVIGFQPILAERKKPHPKVSNFNDLNQSLDLVIYICN